MQITLTRNQAILSATVLNSRHADVLKAIRDNDASTPERESIRLADTAYAADIASLAQIFEKALDA